MSVYVKSCNTSISYFPAGESKLSVELQATQYNEYTIVMNFEDNNDLMNIAFAKDAISRSLKNIGKSYKINLEMKYLPYARQDRVCNPGESHSLRVVCDFINSLKFNTVFCSDIHSDVASALIDNLVHEELAYCAIRTVPAEVFKNSVIVAPDAGAMKKALKLGNIVNCNVYTATKERDCSTGEIKNTLYNGGHIYDKDFLIVDDICEGGFTFTNLAKVLKNYTHGKIYLYVTHGVFSKGYRVFDGLIDGVYTYNLIGSEDFLLISSGELK